MVILKMEIETKIVSISILYLNVFYLFWSPFTIYALIALESHHTHNRINKRKIFI